MRRILPFKFKILIIFLITLLECACDKQVTDKCVNGQVKLGTIKLENYDSFKSIVSKDTLVFKYQDTFDVIFIKVDSVFESDNLEYYNDLNCGVNYRSEKCFITYKTNLENDYEYFNCGVGSSYPTSPLISFAFANDYGLRAGGEVFLNSNGLNKTFTLKSFKIGSKVFDNVLVVTSNKDGYIFLSKNYEILEIRTTNGKIFTKPE